MTLIIEGLVDRKSGKTVPVVRPAFNSIAKLLSNLAPRGVSVVWGYNVQEELRHYAQNVGAIPSLQTIVNNRHFSIQFESARNSKQYARQRYKVESFIWRSVPPQPTLKVSPETSLEFADVFDFAAAATWQQLVNFIKPRYAATRRVKDGIDDDISSYLAPFRNIVISGDVVTRWKSASPSFEDLILLWCFYHSPAVARLVILQDAKPKWLASSSVISSSERMFISVEELIEASASYFHRAQKSVSEAFGLWQRGVNPSVRLLIREGKITEDQADAFLGAYAPLVEDDEAPGLGIIVPEQQPAPLRFSTTNKKIDIVDDKELSSSEPRVIGAVSVCLSALDDLESYTGFENVIPTFRAKSQRIRAALSEIHSGNYDDNTIVQLGVEVDLFESRISAASEILSDMALAEAATFFPIVQGLLQQFSIWSRYKEKLVDGMSSADASQSAVEVLSSTRSAANVFTGRARDRIQDYVTGVTSEIDVSDTGAVLVVENVIAQAASAIAVEAHDSKKQISPELLKEISGRDQDGAASWMVENIAELQNFADSGKISWLKAFLMALTKVS